MTITAGGLVGIGAVPAATLDVVGNIQASANITSAKYFGTVPNNGAIYFVNRSNGNNFMEINSLGRVGIGTAPIGTNMLTISGDVSSTGAIEAGDITATVGVSTPEILPPLGSDLVIMNDTEDTLFTVLEAGGVQVNTGDLQVMTGSLTVGMNAQFGGIMNDGTGKVVCILGDKTLGTCTDAINATGECTCS